MGDCQASLIKRQHPRLLAKQAFGAGVERGWNQRRKAAKAGVPMADVPMADVARTLAIVLAVIDARSEARWAARRSLARSSIRRAINASLLFSSTASASNCR